MKNILIKIALLLPVFILLNCSGGGGASPVGEDYFCTDADGDGFTVEDEVSGTIACSVVDDCNDADVDVFPGAIEYLADGIDQDCDDVDGDNDADDDGITDSSDNCPDEANADQLDADVDGTGNVCDSDYVDPDSDDDGFEDDIDVCPYVSDDQTNIDGDECGAACDDDDTNAAVCSDSDADGVDADEDNCDSVANADQYDTDQDGEGNECDTDDDGDGVSDDGDNCPFTDNPTQGDDDVDGLGNNCEADADGDGIGDDFDNCDEVANVGQDDSDGDLIGDACDAIVYGDEDEDGDGLISNEDNCPSVVNADQSDVDSDGVGDLCDVETCDMESDEIDEDGDGYLGYDDSDCAEYHDGDLDGLADIIDPQDDVKNPWGYIDAEQATITTCLSEISEFTYTYVEGTDVNCGEEESCSNDYVEVDGVSHFLWSIGANNNASTYLCVENSTVEFSYGIYIVQVDADGDGLSNVIDPDNETANSWWTINVDSATTKSFNTSSVIYDYTFVEGVYHTAASDTFFSWYDFFSDFFGSPSDSDIFVFGESEDGTPTYGVVDWDQSQGEVEYTGRDSTVTDYGVYIQNGLIRPRL